MKDRYPAYANLDPSWLVPTEDQPDYQELPGREVPDDANVAEAILGAGRHDAVAIIHHESGECLTYGDLASRSAQIAHVLQAAGVAPGDRVAFRSSNRPEPIVLALATWRLGGIVVPTPPAARASEVRYFLEDTEPKLVVAQGSSETLAEVHSAAAGTGVERVLAWDELEASCGRASTDYFGPHLDANSLAVVWHTGGTTGRPKGCYHTQRRFLQAGYAFASATGIRPAARWAVGAPIGHALGFIYHTIFTLLNGATVVTIEEFARPEVVLEAIAMHKVETFTAIAASWARMLDVVAANPRFSRLPSLTAAYAMWQSASSTHVYDGWKDRGIELLNNFGSTAFATWILIPRRGESFPPASLGRPSPGYTVAVVDPDVERITRVPTGAPGRMAVKGPTALTYWRRPEYQRRDVREGWTLQDDLIRFDKSGNAAYLGRTDFIISTAGYKVTPVEVEEVLARHPAVREVAVVGIADPIRQEIVTAFVVVQAGHSASDGLRRDLQKLVKRELSPYKYPRRVEFIDALPRDTVGKVQPRVLKDLAEKIPPPP